MSRVFTSHDWILPTAVIDAASRAGTERKLQDVYLSYDANKRDMDFLFFKDMDREKIAFVVDFYGNINC